jgi:hypothetical protein
MATKCIQPTPCDCWSEREQHCWASFVIYEACAQQRIAELEARDKLKAEEYDTRIVLAAQFERERDELRKAWLDVCHEGNVPQYEHVTEAHPDGIRHGVRQLAAMWSGEKELRECEGKELKKKLSEAERECNELRAKLADWQETYANIVAECCAPDEHHCTCVPALRAHIKELEAQLARAETRERDLELVNSRVEAFCAEYRSVFKNPVGKRGE